MSIEDVNDNDPIFQLGKQCLKLICRIFHTLCKLILIIIIMCLCFADAYSANVDEVGNDDNLTTYFVVEVTASDIDQEETPNSEIRYNITDVFVTDSVQPFTDVRIAIEFIVEL